MSIIFNLKRLVNYPDYYVDPNGFLYKIYQNGKVKALTPKTWKNGSNAYYYLESRGMKIKLNVLDLKKNQEKI